MLEEMKLGDPEFSPLIGAGILATAIDRNGQEWPVQYSVLTNGGHGNGVLLDASNLVSPGMPKLLAFGDVIFEQADGGHVLGYWRFIFRSYTHCHPTLRGGDFAGRPDSEAIEVRVALTALP